MIDQFIADYKARPTTDAMQAVATAAEQFGYILTHDMAPRKARVDRYDISALLLPGVHQIGDVHAATDLCPSWVVFKDGYLAYDEGELCRAFVEYYGLTIRRGRFFSDSQIVAAEDVKGNIRRSLELVAAQAGGRVYSVYCTLRTIIKDEDPEEKNKPRLSYDALMDEVTKAGYGIRFNVITGEYEVAGKTGAGNPLTLEGLVTLMHDALQDRYKNVSFALLENYLPFAGRELPYNPVLEFLDATPWDGVDRLPQLHSLIGISDTLSKTLVNKWLFQAVALLFNKPEDPFGADGCLTFTGPQGMGKTSLFRHLAMRPGWFIEGAQLRDWDKDFQRRAITKWICELGEVESTFKKADIDALKAFVTQAVDEYRLPYGRSDIKAVRRTALCATCNSDKYLLDTTGNRRWWTIPFRETPLEREELEQLDAAQLWAQIYASVKEMTYKEKARCFRLTIAERDALTERNGQFEASITAQDEVQDILSRDGLVWREMTPTEFKTAWGAALQRYTATQIGKALARCGHGAERKKRGGKVVRLAELPTQERSEAWPG